MNATPLYLRTYTNGGVWRFRGKTADSYRETAEGVAFAVILAFLFRAFLGEAFIIPTGSMAPTLQGRHLELVCPQCGFQFRSGASIENNDYGPSICKVLGGHCPICRYYFAVDGENHPNQRSFAGDRIIVSKFQYDLYDPRRWEVIVFKYPGNAKQNYIKRLVGLPNEMLRIYGGDVFRAPLLLTLPPDPAVVEELRRGRLPAALRVALESMNQSLPEDAPVRTLSADQRVYESWRLDDPATGSAIYVCSNPQGLSAYSGEYRILRKSPHKLNAVLQLVDDTRYVADTLIQAGWPLKWKQHQPSAAEAAWEIQEGGTRFQVTATETTSWIGYRHLVADSRQDWPRVEEGQELIPSQGQAITDYYAYNDAEDTCRPNFSSDVHWVGDLAVEYLVDVKTAQGELTLELVRGGVHFQCRLDAATGLARLELAGKDAAGAEFWDESSQRAAAASPSAATKFRGGGRHRLKFANVDRQLTLWVDGSPVAFDSPTTYRSAPNTGPRWSEQDPGDLEPVRLGVRNAEVAVQRIRLYRDVYYIAVACNNESDLGDYRTVLRQEVEETLQDPRRWNTSPIFDDRREVFFFLQDDQFFPMGDNSPQSKDARLWADNRCDALGVNVYQEDDDGPPPPYVHRKYLIGEALVVYWPHPWRLPLKSFGLPVIPNIFGMKLIR